MKLALPLIAIGGFVVVFLSLALPPIRIELEHTYAAQARALAAIVQVEYALHGNDRADLDRFVRDVETSESTIARIRIYRVVGGTPVVWATSDPSELSSFRPTLADVAPLTTGETLQTVEEVDGVRLLQTVHPLRSGGVIDATVGIYTSLEALEAASGKIRRLVISAVAVLAAGVVLAGGVILYLAVLRPLRRLQRAALRIAAGDLTVRLPEGSEPPAKDELVTVARAFDIMARSLAEGRAELEHMALTDGLTGLPNRRAFDAQLEAEVRRAARLRHPLAVLMVDLDGLKRLNDTQGHRMGDDALVRVAEALRATARDIDLVARYGGDEFAVIQPGSDPKAALGVGKRIRASVEALGIAIDPASGRLLSASVGVADVPVGQDADAAVVAADGALYLAKARGGGVQVAGSAAAMSGGPASPA